MSFPRSRFPLSAVFLLAMLLALPACDGDDGSDNQDPEAAFSFAPEDPVATRTVAFTDESTDPDGQITSWTWQFGNGDTSDEQNPAYAFSEPGTYDVTLTVTDAEGETSMEVTQTVTVLEPGPLGATVAGEWSWVSIEGAQCRDGSATGIGVRTQPGADRLFIYLEGGGACFSEGTCAGNPDSFDEDDFQDAFGTGGERAEAGIFSTTNEDNPVRDWNAVYVPYCTGDVHAGSNPDAEIPIGDVGLQQFVGHENVELDLNAIKTYFRDDLDKVMLTGVSAGGFGTLINFADVADRFDGADAILLDDSGPLFYDDTVFPPFLQGILTDLWNLSESFPEDAGALTEDNDSLAEVYGYYDETYPDATYGLLSHLEDGVIRQFFGVLSPISGAEYAAGLRDLNERAPDAWGTYYQTSAAHTFLGGERFYSTTVSGTPLTDWVADLIDGEVSDVAPASAAGSATAPPVTPITDWSDEPRTTGVPR